MNQSNMEQSLEAVQPESDNEKTIASLQAKIENIKAGREVEALSDNERAEVLELMKQIEQLQQKQLIEKEEKEQCWTREMFVDWAKKEVKREDPEAWVDETFDLHDLAAPAVIGGDLTVILLVELERLPPGLIANWVYAYNTDLREIPVKHHIAKLDVGRTPITEIPDECHFAELSMRYCTIKKVSNNIQIGKLKVSLSKVSQDIKNQLENLQKQGKIGEIEYMDTED
ncbi:hypothetical protein HN958_00365 [Candidatus Falkowbacteria bacterium]|jgi:hypothetical protein|nr:hypothetical protein [Candidatus Falkowbacteria bacterium]MBT7006942.1 hypothetical protein [Candidatus Falkowbacteria bacterium]